jgi:hypothetical protein
MSFEPNPICPIRAQARAERLLKRIAARDALAASLAERIDEFTRSYEAKSLSGSAGAKSRATGSRGMGALGADVAASPSLGLADVADLGGQGIGQNTRRSGMGAQHD